MPNVVKPKRNAGETDVSDAAFRELKVKHRTELGTGDTDLDFPEWLKQEAPSLYPKYLRMTGQGQ